MKKKVYKIKNNNAEYLCSVNFKHIGDGIYIHEFPCYKWNGFITITGKFTAYDDNDEIRIDVFQEDGRPYSPYYLNENSEVVAIVRSNIRKECEQCGIRLITRVEKEKDNGTSNAM